MGVKQFKRKIQHFFSDWVCVLTGKTHMKHISSWFIMHETNVQSSMQGEDIWWTFGIIWAIRVEKHLRSLQGDSERCNIVLKNEGKG